MGGFFDHPAVQGGVAPFVVALVVAILLQRFNLAGLAIAAALATVAYFLNGLTLEPLTVTRKVILLGLAAAAAGFLADALLKPSRAIAVGLPLIGAACAAWAFWTVLAQKPVVECVRLGGGIALYAGSMVAMFGALRAQPVRAGAAGLGLGLGTGIAAILGASATYGLYGIALAAGAGAFLLVQMVAGRTTAAGAAYTFPAALAGALLGAGAMLLAELAWYALATLLLVPAAAFLPMPQKQPIWLQSIVVSLYTFAAAAVPWVLAWRYAGASGG
ncbi:MAG TPA: hypothetical protein VLV90_05615 [Burkholderiales bacterium]|nr:hypothetical protein [Burkholderiales bacterium]